LRSPSPFWFDATDRLRPGLNRVSDLARSYARARCPCIADGPVGLDGQANGAGKLLLRKHDALPIRRQDDRYLVYSDKDRIVQLRTGWVAGRCDKVFDHPEWVALPDQWTSPLRTRDRAGGVAINDRVSGSARR
jgi:hypothetical protein